MELTFSLWILLASVAFLGGLVLGLRQGHQARADGPADPVPPRPAAGARVAAEPPMARYWAEAVAHDDLHSGRLARERLWRLRVRQVPDGFWPRCTNETLGYYAMTA